MFFEILLAIIIGVNAGIITGLIPGVHVNLITAIVVSSVGVLCGVSPFLIALFIISLALTHSFLDSIPSIYLGAPDESMVVGVLPGHQLLMQGKGHLAITYTLLGSLAALLLTILFIPIGIKILPPVQAFISPYIGKCLLGIIIFLIILSKKIFRNSFFFLTAGLLGLICFSLVSQKQILLPLLSGLFGTSTLLYSLATASIMPVQKLSKLIIPIKQKSLEGVTLRATLVGMLASFLPGFGSSQAALVASTTLKEKTPAEYLLLVGGINTVNFSFSLVTMMVLGKARNGAIVGVKSLLGSISSNQLLIFVCVLLLVGGIATILGLKLSRRLARFLPKVNYQKLVWGVIIFLVIIVILLSKLQGLLILLTATSLGILASKYGAQKNMLLGCLILPVILYLW
ncbi:tripartite tricarboxylate transporter permease [Candidatus Woesearchaeota archaeon]|nr:tripartite tricarboxylate transporter permease [Candidatus Woesearchaeota archaeon]